MLVDRFNFEDLDLGKGTGLRTIQSDGEQVSSWGGSVIYDAASELYHMYYSEISRHCEFVPRLDDLSALISSVANDEQVVPLFASNNVKGEGEGESEASAGQKMQG